MFSSAMFAFPSAACCLVLSAAGGQAPAHGCSFGSCDRTEAAAPGAGAGAARAGRARAPRAPRRPRPPAASARVPAPRRPALGAPRSPRGARSPPTPPAGSALGACRAGRGAPTRVDDRNQRSPADPVGRRRRAHARGAEEGRPRTQPRRGGGHARPLHLRARRGGGPARPGPARSAPPRPAHTWARCPTGARPLAAPGRTSKATAPRAPGGSPGKGRPSPAAGRRASGRDSQGF